MIISFSVGISEETTPESIANKVTKITDIDSYTVVSVIKALSVMYGTDKITSTDTTKYESNKTVNKFPVVTEILEFSHTPGRVALILEKGGMEDREIEEDTEGNQFFEYKGRRRYIVERIAIDGGCLVIIRTGSTKSTGIDC